jgi:hypothetical protein
VAHNDACARSSRPATECDCSCLGRYHGVSRPAIVEDPPEPLKISDTPKHAPRKKKAKRIAVAATLAVTGTIGGLTATGTFSSPSGGSGGLTAQVNIDLNKAISALIALGFGGKLSSSVGTSDSSNLTGCAATASGHVRQFLTHYPCEQYAADAWTITKPGATTQVVFGWVRMPTSSLASHYKTLVDTYKTGNPPGVSSAFNGQCYASGQQASTVWTVEVQPTGDVHSDQTVLRAAAQQDLSAVYLASHCAE